MPKLENMSVPYTLEGETIDWNNPTRAVVVIEKMRTGQDPLQGTGLTYGEHLKYDVSPSAPVATSSSPGTPAQPNSIPASSSNPYPGMGKF